MYAVVSIGNTDNKLTQQEWSKFVEEMGEFIRQTADHIHFDGAPPNSAPWQNFAWLVEFHNGVYNSFLPGITTIRERYKQDSAFVMFGKGMFV